MNPLILLAIFGIGWSIIQQTKKSSKVSAIEKTTAKIIPEQRAQARQLTQMTEKPVDWMPPTKL